MRRSTASTPATQALMKIAATTARPARRSATSRAQRKRDPQGHGGERVAEVVDQIGEQRDAVAGEEDDRLSDRRQSEDRERQRHGPDALVGALDAVVDEPVGVAVSLAVFVIVGELLRCRLSGVHPSGTVDDVCARLERARRYGLTVRGGSPRC